MLLNSWLTPGLLSVIFTLALCHRTSENVQTDLHWPVQLCKCAIAASGLCLQCNMLHTLLCSHIQEHSYIKVVSLCRLTNNVVFFTMTNDSSEFWLDLGFLIFVDTLMYWCCLACWAWWAPGFAALAGTSACTWWCRAASSPTSSSSTWWPGAASCCGTRGCCRWSAGPSLPTSSTTSPLSSSGATSSPC